MQSNANSTPQHIKRERFSPLKPILRFSFFSFLKSMIWKITNSTPATLKLHKTRGKNQKNYTERERERKEGETGLERTPQQGLAAHNDFNSTNAGNAFLFWQVKLVGGPLAKKTIINYTPPSTCITINEQNASPHTKPPNKRLKTTAHTTKTKNKHPKKSKNKQKSKQ